MKLSCWEAVNHGYVVLEEMIPVGAALDSSNTAAYRVRGFYGTMKKEVAVLTDDPRVALSHYDGHVSRMKAADAIFIKAMRAKTAKSATSTKKGKAK